MSLVFYVNHSGSPMSGGPGFGCGSNIHSPGVRLGASQ